MRKAFDYVANGGRVVMVGLVQGEISFRDPELHRRELTILGTRNSTRKEFQRIISIVCSNASIESIGRDHASWAAPVSD